MGEKVKQYVPNGPLAGREINNRGLVRVWEHATESWIERTPIDARELVEKKFASLEQPPAPPAEPLKNELPKSSPKS